MSKRPDRAFPVVIPRHGMDAYTADYGMSLRDYFAAAVLGGHVASSPTCDCDVEVIAAGAYALADAMLRRREKP